MSSIEFVLWGDTHPSVEELIFYDSILGETRKLVRGRVTSQQIASFHLTSAIQAFIILALRQASLPETLVALVGQDTSPALSLEYAILRKPAWILDLFGLDSKGSSLVFRYFHRTNPGLKRAVPLKVSLNTHVLPSQNIACSVNGRKVTSREEFALLADNFENHWHARAQARAPKIFQGEVRI